MIKLVYSIKNNQKAIYYVKTAEQAKSVLGMKEDALYYDFLLRNQLVPDIRIGQRLVEFILNKLDIAYVDCATSSCLDLVVIDKAEELFELSKSHDGIKKYLEFNFRVLHRSFLNSVSSQKAVNVKTMGGNTSGNEMFEHKFSFDNKENSNKHIFVNISVAIH